MDIITKTCENWSDIKFEQVYYRKDVEPKIPQPPNIAKKVLKLGFTGAALILPGGLALHATAKYLMDDYNYKCELKCQRDRTISNKSLCARSCHTNALKFITKKLESDLSSCDKSENPTKCRKKILPLLKEYRNRRNKSIINLSYAIKKARAKGEAT